MGAGSGQAAPEAATLGSLSNDLLRHILGMLSLQERCASAAGVCRRWHEVCTGPELLARVDVCTWGSRTRQRVERLQALFAWLATRAAPHAHAVCLRLGCSTKLTDADAAQLRQAATAALASLQAATELRLELVRLSLPVDGWVAALPALRRLQFEQPCEGLALQAPWAEAAALQELTICGAPLQLLAEASLPPALTRLHLGALSRPWLPPQLSALSCLHSLSVTRPRERVTVHPGCCDVLTQLHSLAELRLPSFCRAVLLPCLPSLTRLRQLVLGGRPVDLTAARRSQTAQLVYMEGDDAPGLEGADGMPTREDEQSDGAEWLPPFDVIGPAVKGLQDLFEDPDWRLDDCCGVFLTGPVLRQHDESLLDNVSRACCSEAGRVQRLIPVRSLRSVFAFGSSAFDCLTPDINRLEWRTDFDCFRDYLEGALLELADAATAAAAAAGAAEARVHHEHSGDAVLLAFVLPDQALGMGSHATSLALALSGFSVDAASEGSEAPQARPAAAAAAAASDRPVAAGAAALVQHASLIAARVLERWQAPGYSPEEDSEQLASLCFALQSTVGQRGRLSEADERSLFGLASALWSASLQALAPPGSDGAAMSVALEHLGNELFALVDGDSDDTPDCARYVAFFSGLASSWQAAGQRERAKWCLERAMRYSQQLEGQVAREELPLERKEPLVVALFQLYMGGAKSAADSKQQALANNLLGRAVQLSRHAALGPDAVVCCALAVAELQLQQARAMLAKGGPMCSLAVALLSTSYQQLTGADLEAAAASSAARAAGLLDAKKQVLLQLCRAHLASSDPGQASGVLDSLEALAPGAAASEPEAQLMFVEARVAAGRLAEALRCLVELLQAADPSTIALQQAQAAFLAGLQLALRHASDSTLPSFQSAVSCFCWKATAAASPAALLSLVQMLLAPVQGGSASSEAPGGAATASGAGQASPLAHRLALQALSGDDVAAALHRDAGALGQVHGLLWHSAAHSFEAGSPAAARELFAAALQYCRPEARAKNARALAACHSRMGMHQRALEYLDLAARHEQQPSSLTQLLRLEELVHTGDAAQAVATIRRLASGCPDFHPSLLPSLCKAAAKAQHPAVGKEALSAAVQALIKPDAAASALPAGQEAALLRSHVQAVAACLDGAAQAETAGASSGVCGALYGELVAALKLVAKRLKLLGWARFVGPTVQGTADVRAVCCLAYNQLLQAQQGGAHEHAVALATALWQLLPLADQHLQAGVAGLAQQARILLLATQALLDLHSKQPDSGPKLALAVKLQAKLSQHMAGLPAAQVEHAQLHLLHQLQCLETAARQDDGAALLQCLSKLHPQAAALAGPQRAAIFGMISPQHSQVVQEAAAALLLDSIAAEGSLEAVALAPALFSQLALPSDQRLRVVARCRSLLAAMPAAQRTPGWVQCVQWLAVHAWNAGSQAAQSAGAGEQTASLMAAAVELLEACAPAGADQLCRMRAALAAMPSAPAGGLGQGTGGAPAGGSSQSLGAAVDGAAPPGQPGAAPPLVPLSGPAIPDAADFSFMDSDAGLQPKQRQLAGAGAAAADAAAPAGPAGARPTGIAIPSFREVQQAERQRAAPGNLFRPSGGAVGAAPQPAAPRPSGTINPLAFVDGTPAQAGAAAAAPSLKAPAAAAAAAEMDAGVSRPLPAAAPPAIAPPAPAAAAPPAVPAAGQSALAAAAAAALASAAEGELSEDDSDAEQGAGWLGAVMAAQQRVMGGGGPAKRQAVAAAAGRPTAERRAVAAVAGVAHKSAPAPADGDGPDVLSLGDSEQVAGQGGRLGFMGL